MTVAGAGQLIAAPIPSFPILTLAEFKSLTPKVGLLISGLLGQFRQLGQWRQLGPFA
jgi:hypothetical protein